MRIEAPAGTVMRSSSAKVVPTFTAAVVDSMT